MLYGILIALIFNGLFITIKNNGVIASGLPSYVYVIRNIVTMLGMIMWSTATFALIGLIIQDLI